MLSVTKARLTSFIFIKTNLYNKMVLKDVRYVAKLWLNLISTRRLDGQRLKADFGARKWNMELLLQESRIR